MSSEWEDVCLGDLISIRGGLSYKSTFLDKGNKKIVGMGCVSFSERFLSSGCRSYDGEHGSQHEIVPGDIVIATRQQSENLPILGFPAILPGSFDSQTVIAGTNLYKVDNLSQYPNSFIFWLLRGAEYREHVRSRASGSTVRMITKDVVEDFSFLCPPVAEAERIASFLDLIQDKIELNRKTNETLEGIAKALFKSWFVDFDPVREKAEGRPTGLPNEISELFPDSFEESELGQIPSGWKVDEIGNVVECVGGSTPSTKESEYWDEGVNHWATPKDLSDLSEPFLLDTAKRITDLGVKRISSGVLPMGTVLLSSRAPVGYVAVAKVPLSVNQGFIAMKPSALLPTNFLLNWTLANVQQFKDRASGTTFAEISKKAFRPVPVLLPRSEVVNAFTEIVEPLYENVVLNMKQSASLTALRDALLPRLISGELRVPDAEKMIEEVGV